MKYMTLLIFFTFNSYAQYIGVDLNTKDLTPLPIVKDHGRAPAKMEDSVIVEDGNRSEAKDKYNRFPAIAPDESNFQKEQRPSNSIEK